MSNTINEEQSLITTKLKSDDKPVILFLSSTAGKLNSNQTLLSFYYKWNLKVYRNDILICDSIFTHKGLAANNIKGEPNEQVSKSVNDSFFRFKLKLSKMNKYKMLNIQDFNLDENSTKKIQP